MFATLTLLLTVVASSDIEAPPSYFPCASCHFDDGYGSEAIGAPALAGLSKAYLVRQMKNFRSGARGRSLDDLPGRQMSLVAAVYDDAAIEEVSIYTAALEPSVPQGTLDGDPRRGELLWVRCAVCHGSVAEGNESLGAPALAYLQDWYIVRQVDLYRRGLRGNADAFGAQMRASVFGINDQQMRDLSAYIGELSDETRKSKETKK